MASESRSRAHRARPLVAAAAAIALGAAGALVGAQAANAFSLNGCRWNTGTITISDSLSGDYSTAYSQTRSNWSNNSDVNLSGGSGSPFTVATTYNTGAPGVTQRSCTILGFFNYAHVYGNTYHMSSYSTVAKRALWAHELGHAFGLAHTSSTAAIMYPTMDMYWLYGLYTAQTDDINGVNSLY